MTDIPCRHRPECDGCPLFEEPQERAHALKLETTHRALRPFLQLGAFAVTLPEKLHTEASLGYRNRARMVVDGHRLGFYRAGTREVVAIERCLVHAEPLEALLHLVRGVLTAASQEELDALHFVDARWGDGAGVATFIGTGDGVRTFAERLIEKVPTWGIAIALREDEAGSVMPSKVVSLSPPEAAPMPSGVVAPPGAFYQVNDAVLAAIHAAMRSELEGRTTPLVDAYCGVGTHAVGVGEGRPIAGFDAVEAAIDAARTNAEFAGLNATFEVRSDDDLADFTWPEGAFDVIANPARAGMTRHLVAELASRPVEKLLYLSCEPSTLARDLGRLAERGFVVESLRAFDMMPRTQHIEILATLRRDADATTNPEQSRWPDGVSGPPVTEGRKVGFARVVGRAPHGQPPNVEGHSAPIQIQRLRNVGDHSVIRWETSGGLDGLRARLRRWGHPVVGDATHGDPSVNAIMERNAWVDRPLLHVALVETPSAQGDGESTTVRAAVPAELYRFFKLPTKVFEAEIDR